MIPKLRDYMNKSRIPLVFRPADGAFELQLQVYVAREDSYCAGHYCEYEYLNKSSTAETIGRAAKDMLARFHELSDLTLEEFRALTGMDMASYEAEKEARYEETKRKKAKKELYTDCFAEYDVVNDRYALGFSFEYREGRKIWMHSAGTTGEKGVLTFEEPLEFDADVTPERLGEMLLEGLDRSRRLSEAKSSGVCPPKLIDLLEGTMLEVTPPKDKHFEDWDDCGAGEIYQDYAYIAREGAEASADFMLTVAPELHEALGCDNIRSAWTAAFGKADEINVSEGQYGIYRYRAEFRNSKACRIAYFRELGDGSVLECLMEVAKPAKRQKLIEKLTGLFERFAAECKIK